MNVVVCGWVFPYPVAGLFWHSVSFALGFRALGHDVWYLEDAGDAPWGWDIDADIADPDCACGVRRAGRQLDALGFEGRWCFRSPARGVHAGMDERAALDVVAAADVLVNVSLTLTMRPEYRRVPHRLGVDTDPVFTQIRIARGDPFLATAPETHTRLFTFGRPPLPAQSHEWVPTRQPVVTSLWPDAGVPDGAAPFSTVTSWSAYDAVTWEGCDYGAKDRSFAGFIDLPATSPAPLEIALAGRGHSDGARVLRQHGWRVVDGFAVSRSADAYRNHIASSRGELGFAKHGYVAARSGWFSERTCCYLASGRPAVVQDTGWTDWLPEGRGLLAFTTPAEALSALREVAADPAGHARAARRIAADHFDAGRVCAEMLAAAL